MAFPYKGVDFIGFDNLLDDDERLSSDTARQFIEDNLIPIIEECNREGRFPRELIPQMGQLRFLRRQPPRVRLCRYVQRGVRVGHAGI